MAEWSREKITAVLTRESDFMPVGLSSASRNVNDISPTLLTMKDVGAVLVSEELLAADASLVKRLSNWPKNVPLVLLSPSGNWKNIFAKINEFSKGLQQVNPAQFAAMITPQTEGIVDINDAENVIEVAEFMTGNKIVAYAVEREISDPYRNILQGSYGIVYDLPEEGSREVTLGAGAFNELLKFLALSPDEQAEVLKALNGIRVVKPSAVAGELGQYVFEYSQTIRGL
ncbi:MAG: hypothetical protein HY590_03040 [Candidatus Omnitrophica bacterium]|nr:hypothetical protein [Candidatus Omnitrophota bacterium]